MNRKLADLIEQITTDAEANVEAIREALNIDDPVERFRALEQLPNFDQETFTLAIDRAKALTIDELREDTDDGKPRSLEAIGKELGVSRQRVHQLTNPESRRQRWTKKQTPAKR